MNLTFATPSEVAIEIASALRERRLQLNLTQRTLSKKAGVSLAVLKKFESTGKISLQTLLKIALALGSLGDFQNLFKTPDSEDLATLDEIIQDKKRKRGRR